MSTELFNTVLAGDVAKVTALLKGDADCNASNDDEDSHNFDKPKNSPCCLIRPHDISDENA